MGIKNFKSILNDYVQMHNIELKILHNNRLTSDCIIIDTMSFFYGDMLTGGLSNESMTACSGDIPHTVYDDLVESCFNKTVNVFDNDDVFKSNEIFISFDLGAPQTKLKTQMDRRKIPNRYVDQECRVKFYEALVCAFIKKMKLHNAKSVIIFPVSFENYESQFVCDDGEGEYLCMKYITDRYMNCGYRKFTILGNDNDILLFASLYNTLYADIVINYIPLQNIRNHTFLKFSIFSDYVKFIGLTFALGNDFIPSIISGTSNQIRKLIECANESELFTHELFTRFVQYTLRDFTNSAGCTQVLDQEFIILILSNFIYTICMNAIGLCTKVKHTTNAANNVISSTKENLPLKIFVNRFVWNILYIMNTLYFNHIGGTDIYKNFGKIYSPCLNREINDPLFLEDVQNNSVIRYLILKRNDDKTLFDYIHIYVKQIAEMETQRDNSPSLSNANDK